MDFYLLALIFLSVISHAEWFNPSSILYWSDWNMFNNGVVRDFINFGRTTWLAYGNFGSPVMQIGFNLFLIPWGFLGSYAFGSKLSLFIPIALLSLLAPYYLARHLTNDKKISFLCALFYGFNTYLLAKEGAHVPIAFAVAIAPLILLVFMKLVKKFNYKQISIFSLLFFVLTAYEIRIAFIMACVLVFYTVFFFNKKLLNAPKIAFFFLLNLVLNLYLFLPLIFSTNTGIDATTSRSIFGNWLFDLQHAFALSNSSWTGGTPGVDFVLQPILPHLWIVPLLCFGIIMIAKRTISRQDHKYILFFLSISLIGIFLTKQAAEPLPDAYAWLYEHVFGFDLFRESSKFYLLTALGYLGLLAFSLKYVLFENIKITKVLKTASFALLTIVLLINAKPYITKEAGTLFVSREQPDSYKQLSDRISNQSDSFRTIWIPRASQWSYFDSQKPRISAVDTIDTSLSLYYADSKKTSRYADFIFDPFDQNYSNFLADISGIKYFIIPLDEGYEQQRLFSYYGSNKKEYNARLQQLSYLTKSPLEVSDELNIYENKDTKQPIFTFDNLTAFKSADNLENKFDILNNYENENFYFIINNSEKHGTSQILTDVFENLTADTISSSTTIAKHISLPSQNYRYALVSNSDLNTCLFYQDDESSIQIYSKSCPGKLIADTEPIFPNNSAIKTLYSSSSGVENLQYIETNGALAPLEKNKEVKLVDYSTNAAIKLISASDTDDITNPSFEEGAWQENVGDCHNYDDNPIIAMRLNQTEKTDGDQALQLESTRHIACVNQKVAVEESEKYILSFDYQSPNAEKLRYRLAFNDKNKTILDEYVPISNSLWENKSQILNVPAGADSFSITLYSLSSGDEKTNIITRYDNFILTKLIPFATLDIKVISADSDDTLAKQIEAGSFITINDLNYTNYQPLLNLIPNASFEEGMWQQNVNDCNNYDANPIIDMKLSTTEKTQGLQSIQLESTRHIACTSPTKLIPIKDKTEYTLSFDYQTPDGSKAKYYLGFDDSPRTKKEEILQASDSNWQTFTTNFSTPAGAENMTLVIYAQPGGKEQTTNITRYDNFNLHQTSIADDKIILYKSKGYEQISLPTESDISTIKYENPDIDMSNLIENPSFESELWKDSVGDCNNYDQNAILDMKQNFDYSTEGIASLQLEATKHLACTSIEIPTEGKSRYLLSFDYQSGNAKYAGYHISFDDEDGTKISERLPIPDANWHSFNTNIDIPTAATTAILHVYAYQSDEKENNIVHYDNFRLSQIPDLDDHYHLISHSTSTYQNPVTVTYNFVNPTRKTVSVLGASTSFYLAMNESYHPQWEVYFNNRKTKGLFYSWLPFVNPDKIDEDSHYELDGFLNAWFIDIDDLCVQKNLCTKNSDGTYNLELMIEYSPQRWFYLGFLISCLTLAGMITFLYWSSRNTIKKNIRSFFSVAFWKRGLTTTFIATGDIFASLRFKRIRKAASVDTNSPIKPAFEKSKKNKPAKSSHRADQTALKLEKEKLELERQRLELEQERSLLARTRASIAQQTREQTAESQFDVRLVPDASHDDIDWELVEETRPLIEASLSKKFADSEEMLRHMFCLDQQSRPTTAGILVYGRDPQRFFPNSYLTLVKYDDDLNLEENFNFKGNLLYITEDCFAKLKETIPVKEVIVEEAAQRHKVPLFPYVAVREIFINAIAHRDYSIPGSRIIIAMYKDKLEIKSPGSLPAGITPATIKDAQYSRNPLIAAILFTLGYIEQIGSGIDRTFMLYRDQKKKPDIKDIGTAVCVTLPKV